MNADLKRVRDSSLDPSPSSPKRRALAAGSSPSSPSSSSAAALGQGASGSGSGDGDGDDGLEDWMRVVESKRKEAIYRQMLDYRRNCEREAARANALERQRRSLEASLRSVEACWAQLVNSVRERAGRQDDAQDGELLNISISPSTSSEQLDGALKGKLSATLRLVSLFADAAAGKPSSSMAAGDLHQQLAKLQAESSTLRTSSDQLQSEIDQLRQSRDTYQHDLQRAERRLDRQRMEFDKEREEWRTLRESSAAAKPLANGSGHSTPNARASEAPAPEVPAPVAGGVATSSDTEQRAAELEKLADSRLKQLEALRGEHTALSQEVDRLKQLTRNPPESALRESPFFQVYLQQLATQTARAEALQQRFEAAEHKLDQLRDNNLEFREAVLVEARTEVETLRQQMSKKDTDLARLRGQRDEYGAELSERKARDAEKARYAEEMEALCNARQERINYLSSEVKRLRGSLAARDGAESYLAFLKADGDIDADYIKTLEERLASAKDQVAALTAQLSAQANGAYDASAAAAVRTELEEARRSLAKYERVLGPSAPEDVGQLSEKLKKEAEAKTKLELQLADAEETTNSLYSELEGVTKLWEGLDNTLRTKVFELKDGELRMQRLYTEKAKADNKYFQAMRSKEAVDAECKTAQRSVEKQLKLLERAKEVEKALTAQISQQEKGLTIAKNSSLELQTQLAAVTSEKRQVELRLAQKEAALAEAQQVAQARVAEAAADKDARSRIQDELQATERVLAKLKEKQDALTATSAATNTSAADLTIREEREKLLKILRCSCCEINFKQQVIVKCMHTFCKDCLDQRIASRQRKCPACGLAFAKEDCQTLYWQ